MTLVQGSHRRHEADGAAATSSRREHCAQLVDGAHRPHAASSPASPGSTAAGPTLPSGGCLAAIARVASVEGVEYAQQLGDALGNGIPLGADRLSVAAGDRTRKRRLRRRPPSSRPSPARAGRASRATRRRSRPAPRRRTERDQVVRGDRGRGVVGGPIVVGDGNRRQAESSARPAAAASAAGDDPATAAAAPPMRASPRRRRTSSADAARRPVRRRRRPGSRSGCSPVAPEQWPTMPRAAVAVAASVSPRRGGGRDLAVGHAQQDDRRAGDVGDA